MTAPVEDVIAAYFEGEKNAGLFLAGLGVASLAAAAALFPARLELRAFAVTLLVFALLELSVGVGLYLKTGPQVDGLLSQLSRDPATFYASERPRMATVQRNFVLLETLWLVLIVGSAAVAVWQKRSASISGVALGLLVTTSVLLTFDIIAESRGSRYLDALQLP